MSDVIPFPRSKEKLIREIKQSFNSNDLEQMYQLFEDFEEHFELDEQMALLKCSMLYNMQYFLELREEAIILLKQGTTKDDDLMVYYVKSLNGLGQYFEVVEVINQIIDEVNDHRTRIEHVTLAPNVLSIMLEYLRFAEYDQEIDIIKYNFDMSVMPSKLPGLEHTEFKLNIIPNVIQHIEEDAAQLIEEALHLMNNHAILFYPLDIERIAHIDVWVEAYTNYFKAMIGLESLDESNAAIQFITEIDKLNN